MNVHDEDSWRMVTTGEMGLQMTGHGTAVVSDQKKVVAFAPNQNVWIRRAQRWGSGVADTAHGQRRRHALQNLAQTTVHMLIKQVLNSSHAVGRLIDGVVGLRSAWSRRNFSITGVEERCCATQAR